MEMLRAMVRTVPTMKSGLRRALLAAVLALAAVLPVQAQDSGARIDSPTPGATVHDVVVVTGTAVHGNFNFYKVEFAREPSADWVVIGGTMSSQVQSGVLVQWDTRSVPDGSYSLRLLVVDQTGNYLEDIVRQVVVSNSALVATETPTLDPAEADATATAQADETATAEAHLSATPTTPATPADTPTVIIAMPDLGTPTIVAGSDAEATAMPEGEATEAEAEGDTTVTTTTPPDDEGTGTGSAMVDLAKGVFGEVLDALGLSSIFKGTGSAMINGALVAVGAFAVVGVLALVRQLVMLAYHAAMRR